MDFTTRSDKTELLDRPDIPSDDIKRNLYELSVINRWLGGHAITISGFKKIVKDEKKVHVCEIGCGGGDNLKAIEKKMNGKEMRLVLTGIDINPDCVSVADQMTWSFPAQFLIQDYKNVHFDIKPDVLFCSLFCHHFPESELISMFRWLHANSRFGFFVNDLHRHPIAYHSIRLLTFLFSKSYLVKNDAPISVLRGFKKKELENILYKAGIENYSIQWKWAFRWLVSVKTSHE
jgi:2-polyprenyl-3-methyl-5-hydroxy-6-metoxy-1,4-benzoquinol methylase